MFQIWIFVAQQCESNGTSSYLWKENPENVVEQQSREQQGRNFEAGQPYKGDERHAKAHAHKVHEGPVASQHPDAHHTYKGGGRNIR